MKKTATPEQCREVQKHLRKELRRFALSQRQLRLASWLVDVSLGWGKRDVRVPTLEVLASLLGMAASHVTTCLKELQERRMIVAEQKDGGWVISVNVDADRWQVAPLLSRATQEKVLSLLRNYNGLEERGHDYEEILKNFKVDPTGIFSAHALPTW